MVKLLNQKERTDKFKDRLKSKFGDEFEIVGEYINQKIKIKVKHKRCGKVREIRPDSLLSSSNCLICYRESKRKTNKEFISQVKTLVGSEYLFLDDYQGVDTKIRVKHNLCGNIYEVTPDKFMSGRRCPECMKVRRSRSQITSFSTVNNRVSELTGGDYCITGDYGGTNGRTTIKHLCGYSYEGIMKEFYRGNYRCPVCTNNSFGEDAINKYLTEHNITYYPEYSYPDLYDKSSSYPLRFDFAIADSNNQVVMLIEYDGTQHFYESQRKDLKDIQRRDRMKDEYCKQNNIPLYRISFKKLRIITEVLDSIFT